MTKCHSMAIHGGWLWEGGCGRGGGGGGYKCDESDDVSLSKGIDVTGQNTSEYC